jgi:peptidoglycan/LPS O-acetylase OafA/YrhL
LITSLIVGEIRQGGFSIILFYERRVRRIFPALIAVLIFASAATWRLLLSQQLDGFAESVVATTLFVSNVLFWSESGYFTAPAIEKPLLHTWLTVRIALFTPLASLCIATEVT